jgi:EmrB/QacA subfamily drug resistance transporter
VKHPRLEAAFGSPVAASVSGPRVRTARSQRRRVLLVTSLGVFMVSLDTTIVNVAFPAIQSTFPGTTQVALSWVLNAYFIVFAALLVSAGRVADLVGRRRVFYIGLNLFTLASGLCGLAPTASLLIAARALQAIGAAALIPASLALLLPAFEVSRRATAIGLWGAIAAIASALGPILGSALLEWANWRWAFFINLPVGLFAWLWGRKVLDESRDPDAVHWPDPVGVLAAIATVGLFALWIIQGAAYPWFDPRRLASLAGAIGLFPLLIWRCARHPSPVLDLSLFRIRSFTIANLATLLFSAAFFSALLGYVLFLTSVWHYPPLTAGLAITTTPMAAAVVAGPAGLLADRFGHRWIVVSGTVVFAVGAAWLLLRVGPEVAYVRHWLPGSLLMGAGVGMAFPTLSSASMLALPPARFAVGSAVNVTSRQLGGVLGVAILIVLLSRPSTGAPAEMQFRAGWIFMGLISLAAGLVSLALGGKAHGDSCGE